MSVRDWPVFVIVDSHEEGGFDFVEIEDGEGQSISVENNPQPDGLIAIGPLYRDPPEPTHYAVVDEYGEIVYSRRISGLLNAEAQCKHYIKLCDKDPVTRSHMNNWTIKGVTVHE